MPMLMPVVVMVAAPPLGHRAQCPLGHFAKQDTRNYPDLEKHQARQCECASYRASCLFVPFLILLYSLFGARSSEVGERAHGARVDVLGVSVVDIVVAAI
jgi:hypothetical protein